MAGDPDEKIRNRIKSTKTGKELEEMLKPMMILAKKNKALGVAEMSKRNAKIVNSWWTPRKSKI